MIAAEFAAPAESDITRTPAHLRCWQQVAEQSLLARLRIGDAQAFDDLVQFHRPRMLSVALRILKSDHDAADAVQDAFISAFQSIAKFDGESQLATWLHSIVVNACLMQLRRRRRRPASSLNAIEADAARLRAPRGNHGGAPHPGLETSDETAEVMQLIERLPDNYREVVMIRIVEGNDTLASSRLLQTSESVVKTRLYRARRMLRRMAAKS
jgi:RNA polymerase sigma-70 factor (ECF subfamily)